MRTIIDHIPGMTEPGIATCPKCDTRFDYREQDLRFHQGEAFWQTDTGNEREVFYNGTHLFVRCPVCEHRIKTWDIRDYSRKELTAAR